MRSTQDTQLLTQFFTRSRTVKKVIALLKNIRPIKLLTVFLAGFILFFTQACNSVAASTPGQTAPRQTVGEQSAPPNSQNYVPKGTNAKSPYEGGINNFSDVDPRTKGANLKAKAEALKENAERNVIDQTSNVGENTRRILGKKGENIEDLGKNLQRNTQETADKAKSSATDFARGASKGIENIKDNTSDAAKGTIKNAQGAAEDAKYNAQRTVKNAQSAAEDAKYNAQRTADKAGDAVEDAKYNAQRTADKAGDAVKRTAKEANNSTVEKGQQAAENTGNFFEKVGSAIKDAVD